METPNNTDSAPSSPFVHLHLHTQYSLLDGAIRFDDLIAKAKEYNMPAVAITDHGNMFATPLGSQHLWQHLWGQA
jgi:DNA polymerase-3 subunit alpha